MNNLLQIKLPFRHELNSQKPAGRNLRARNVTSVEKIESLSEDLRAVLRYYKSIPKVVNNIIIDVNYNDIVAKSNRIVALLKPNGKTTNDMIVGARFSDAIDEKENHIITYYIDYKTILNTLKELNIIKKFLSEKLSGQATADNFNYPKCKISYEGYNLSKSKIRDLIVDCSVVESFSVPKMTYSYDKESFLITFYKTELSLERLLEKLKIDSGTYPYFFYGSDSISVTKDLFDILQEKVPYLISMISSDISRLTLNEIKTNHFSQQRKIPLPNNEPVIGVIDALFDEQVYFSPWVKNEDYLDEFEKYNIENARRDHGTEVSSIIVDGPSLNPHLDDGCGRFRVKHFGVCAERISITRLVRKIREIVSRNPDIHVWNLSLGTEEEISKNFISYDAAAIDELQADKNIIFVVSGTNDNRSSKKSLIRVGSPADSLNSLVVNSVRRNGSPTSYSRKGEVLSFFNKPDVSYYGGDKDEPIMAYSSAGDTHVFGTSFAAPWISRKLCYLIDIIGIPREVAKAMIIDAAAAWEYKKSTYKIKDLVGYGVVPIKIQDILTTRNEEIKFIVYGTASTYKTVNYSIPIPKNENNRYPYIARATLCYFPECSRNQGVDYTDRELSLKFGRINKKGTVVDINENIQDENNSYTDERQSREDFRKWENSKFISKVLKKNQALMSYDDRLWGIVLVSKERLGAKIKKGLNFGVVITLKEIMGINRIQDFIKACTLRGIIVKELEVSNLIELYNSNQENIQLE